MDMEKYENLDPNIFLFINRQCYPDWRLFKRQDAFQELYFITAGRSIFSVNGQTFTAKSGDVVYIPGNSLREARTFKEAPMHTYAINFFWFHDNHDPLPFKTVTENIITDEMLRNLQELDHIWSSKKSMYTMRIRGLFLLILHRLLENYSHNAQTYLDPRIKKVVEHMTAHYAENIDIDTLALTVRLHPVYLGQLFKKNTGTTFKEYLNRIRVKHAEIMLSTGKYSVSEAAEQCGFHDISYFSKVFKNTKGYPPSVVKQGYDEPYRHLVENE